MSILDGDLAEQLTDALTAFDIPQACVVSRQVQDQDSPPWEPTFTTVDHACSGWRDEYSALDRANSDILQTDAKVYVVASSLDVTPTTSDKVTVGGATFSVISVQPDPAGACWLIQART